MKIKIFALRLTSEQYQVLLAKARANGFLQIFGYIRSVLFIKMPVEEKIDKIYKKVVENG